MPETAGGECHAPAQRGNARATLSDSDTETMVLTAND
jgi:hypothetical protein